MIKTEKSLEQQRCGLAGADFGHRIGHLAREFEAQNLALRSGVFRMPTPPSDRSNAAEVELYRRGLKMLGVKQQDLGSGD